MGTYAAMFGGTPQSQLGKLPKAKGSPTDEQNRNAGVTAYTGNQVNNTQTAGVVGNAGAQMAQGAPAPTQANATQGGQVVRPQMTFAQMQAQGQARPAPPMVQPTAQFQGSPQAMQARNSLQQQAMSAAAQPTRYDASTFTTIRDAAMGDLNADFERQQLALNEEMARRGLYDSSIAANNFRDLGGQQARAMAGLNASLLQDAAATQMSDRLGAAGLSSQLAQLAGSQDLAGFEANRVGQALDTENAFRGAEFSEGQRQFDLQQQLAERLGIGGLGLEAERVNLSRDELALRGDLGQQEQQLARQRLMQEGTLAQAEQNLERDRLTQQGMQFNQGLAAETQNQALERALRERLGMTELAGVYQGADGTTNNTIARDRLAVDREVGGNQTLIQLAQLLGLTGLGTALGNRPASGGVPGTGGGGVVPPTLPPSGGSNGGRDSGGDGSVPPLGSGDGGGGPLAELNNLPPELLAQLRAMLGGG